MKVTQLFSVLLGAAFLSGCFISASDLILPKDADYPIADGARFTVHSLKEDGTSETETPDKVVVTRRGAHYLYAVNDEPASPGLMDDIGGGNYIAMIRDDGKDGEDGEAMYAIFARKGESWMSYALICSDFEELAVSQKMKLADFGITKSGSNCSFSSYADLKKAVALELRYGKPDAEYVPAK